MRLVIRTFLFISISLLSNLSLIAGEIYSWVDENGKTHYSDKTNKRLKEQKQKTDIEAKTVKIAPTNQAAAPSSFERVYQSMKRQEIERQKKKERQQRLLAKQKSARRACAEAVANYKQFGINSDTLTYMIDEQGNTLTEKEQQMELKRMRQDLINQGCLKEKE